MSDALRRQLQEVYETHGALTPALVVDEARDPEHPLHSRFQWDDSVAGEAWRREQAHRLIQSVRVVYREADEKEGPRTVRAFHAIPTNSGHGYVPVDDVRADPLMTRMVLDEMEREWKALRRRYAHFAEFVEMVRRDIPDAA